ncbi:hypothetical protein RB195_017627 [Necator americanus]
MEVPAEPAAITVTSSPVTEAVPSSSSAPVPSTSDMSAIASATENVSGVPEPEEMEEEATTSVPIIELPPVTSTAIPTDLLSSTTELYLTTPEIATSAAPVVKTTSTENTQISEVTEIPLTEKESIIGPGNPDLSRIYRKLFPYHMA